jgi:hypothetical protein
MEILPFGLFGDESRERPTGGLADYRQVKPWKKRDISGELYSAKRAMAKSSKPLKHRGKEETEEGENCQHRRNCQKIQIV